MMGTVKRNHSLGLGLTLLAVVALSAILWLTAYAEPIDPPAGYPKLSLSIKEVNPELANTGGAVLHYVVEIRNTGAYTAANATLSDTIPAQTTYNDDLWASVPSTHTFENGVLSWMGDVGFDTTTVVSFSVTVSDSYAGSVLNTAVISQALIAKPVTVTAETIVTDDPILVLDKSSEPAKPGANKPLTYTLEVVNEGQPANSTPITVVDRVPADTTLNSVGPDGTSSPGGDVVTWTRTISLGFGEGTSFWFSVDVGDVPSGTEIVNKEYSATSPDTGVTAGDPYTVTIVDPILTLYKEIWPDPPGSNREATYTLSLINHGSLATALVITDRVPAGVTYVRGGSEAGGLVTWNLDRLDTGESAAFTFTIYISDVMEIEILNDDYAACCAEGVCQAGEPLSSVVAGPTFEVEAYLDPIAKKPGGGSNKKPVTPTLILHNLGPGNAIDLQATSVFTRISVSANDLYADPPIGTPPPFPDGPDCGENCVSYVWYGDLNYEETVTFTTYTGQSTIVGEEGTPYTATLIVSDTLANTTTVPISGTAEGKITHYANVEPIKFAPAVVGPGELLTYTIESYNRGLSTQDNPILTDVVPLSTTFVWASDDGVTLTVSDTLIVSWALPLLSPGEGAERQFSVQVDEDVISGTKIVNEEYSVFGYGNIVTDGVKSGPPVTTTVKEVGLIHSYKEVTPTLLSPGEGNVLTFSVHVVNSSPVDLFGVEFHDQLPWALTTYQRDAVASAGTIVSDIVSIHWLGDVLAFSEQVVTFTVAVDPDYEGPVTNTATIQHSSLNENVVVEAVAYVTDDPVLHITKSAKPDPVNEGKELEYTIRIENLGQQATSLVVSDTIPADTEYVAGSATGGGKLVGNHIEWKFSALNPGERRTISFRVKVGAVEEVVNDAYAVWCAEGAIDYGPPVVTRVVKKGGRFYLPIILRNGP
ncbi:MAG: hypothetical protein PVF47_01855 [Anaerolineae bacterium]|jgi:uncharacterized repeat protein (TIGR01451 family)